VHFVHLPLKTRCTASGADFAPSTKPKAALANACGASISFLRRDLPYDPDVAGAFIERDLLALLPE
jgi:hypothetical protein